MGGPRAGALQVLGLAVAAGGLAVNLGLFAVGPHRAPLQRVFGLVELGPGPVQGSVSACEQFVTGLDVTCDLVPPLVAALGKRFQAVANPLFPCVGMRVTLVGDTVALIRRAVPLVGDEVPPVGDLIALAGTVTLLVLAHI
jgi:hypothetical protein